MPELSPRLYRHFLARAVTHHPDVLAASILHCASVRLGGPVNGWHSERLAEAIGCDVRTVMRLAACLPPRDPSPAGVAAWVRELVAEGFDVDPERLAGVMLAGLAE